MPKERKHGQALAAVFTGHGNPFSFRHFPIPRPAAGEILVKIECSTICGSDVHTWKGHRQEPTPCILGHEIVGRIAAFGEDCLHQDLRGRSLQIGDRVTWTLAASCGTCFFCRKGLPQKCEHLFKYGHVAIQPGYEFSGGYAEYCLLTRGTGVIGLPDSLSNATAAPANCATATVAASLALAGSVEGASVAILGCGVLGLTACAMAKAFGAAEIIACDIMPEREEMARAFGATRFALPEELHDTVLDHSERRGADIALEFAGVASTANAAFDIVRTGGTAVIAGATTPGKTMSFDAHQLMRRMVTLKGLHNYTPNDLITALDFLEQHQSHFPFALMQGRTFRLDQIEEAFAAATQYQGQRIAIIP